MPAPASGKPKMSSRSLTSLQPVGGLDTCLCPGSGVHTQLRSGCLGHRASSRDFSDSHLQGHIDSVFIRKFVEVGQGRRFGGRHDRFDIHCLCERKQPPAGAFVRGNRARAVGY